MVLFVPHREITPTPGVEKEPPQATPSADATAEFPLTAGARAVLTGVSAPADASATFLVDEFVSEAVEGKLSSLNSNVILRRSLFAR